MNERASVSITDIAKEAGVSVTTVSRVLSARDGDIRISQKTRDLVMEVADRLGYQRNAFASALRSNRTGIIGAINRAVSGTYMSRLAHQCQLVAQARGIELFIGAPHESDHAIAGQLTVLQNQLFDGILFLGDLSDYQGFVNGAFKRPHVHVIPGNEAVRPLVTVDEAHGVSLALDYLTSLGHQRIACLGSPAWPWDGRRMQFYVNYMAAHGLKMPEGYVADLARMAYPAHSLQPTDLYPRVQIYVQQLMDRSDAPTAIFCTNDGFGAATIKALYRLGLRVPDDVSVVGYGNHHDSTITYPEITTINIPNAELAEVALELLQQIIETPADSALREQRVLLTPTLLLRESVQKL